MKAGRWWITIRFKNNCGDADSHHLPGSFWRHSYVPWRRPCHQQCIPYRTIPQWQGGTPILASSILYRRRMANEHLQLGFVWRIRHLPIWNPLLHLSHRSMLSSSSPRLQVSHMTPPLMISPSKMEPPSWGQWLSEENGEQTILPCLVESYRFEQVSSNATFVGRPLLVSWCCTYRSFA